MQPMNEINIVSFNIGQSGLPGTLRKVAQGRLDELLKQLSASVLCLQETKCSVVALREEQALAREYSSFFSSHKGGALYAGVATIVHNDLHVLHEEEGLTGALLGLSVGSRASSSSTSSSYPPSIAHEPAPAVSRGTGLTDSTPKPAGDVIPANDVARVPLGRVFSPLELDYEGRCVIVEIAVEPDRGVRGTTAVPAQGLQPHRLVIINTYCPALASEERAPYKWQYHEALARKAFSYYAKYGSQHVTVVICGDINIAHTKLDHADWQDWERRHGQKAYESGVFRRWMEGLMNGVSVLPDGSFSTQLASVLPQSTAAKANGQSIGCMYDPFRIRWPSRAAAFTCWSTLTGARATNYGTRLDYFLVDSSLCPHEHEEHGAEASTDGRALCKCSSPLRLRSCDILQTFAGSDHCPITLSILADPWRGPLVDKAGKEGDPAPHPMSANALPQFKKRQSTVSSFFRKPGASDTAPSSAVPPTQQVGPSTTSLPAHSAQGSTERAVKRSQGAAAGTGAGGESDVLELVSSQEDGAVEVVHGLQATPQASSGASTLRMDALGTRAGQGAERADMVGKKRRATDTQPAAGLSSWLTKRPVPVTGAQRHGGAAPGQGPSAAHGSAGGRQTITGLLDCDRDGEVVEGGHVGVHAASSSASATQAAPHSATIHSRKEAGTASAGAGAGKKPNDTKAWAGLLTGPVPPPLCRCGLSMVFRTVLKEGPNKGKVFYVCVRPEGARCDTFIWGDVHRKAVEAGTASTST